MKKKQNRRSSTYHSDVVDKYYGKAELAPNKKDRQRQCPVCKSMNRTVAVTLYQSASFGTTELWKHLETVHQLSKVAAVAVAPIILSGGQQKLNFGLNTTKVLMQKELVKKGSDVLDPQALLRATAEFFIDSVVPYNCAESDYFKAMLKASNPATVVNHPTRRSVADEVLKICQELKEKLLHQPTPRQGGSVVW